METMLTNIAQKMTELGFTLYEAKAYVCLLQNHPATRYEISKKSGVPRSAIYDVIHRLEEAGAVNVISRNPEKYMPLPPEQFTELLENRYNEKIRKFYDSVAGLNVNLEMGNLWDITGYENLLIKAREMIEGAETELYLSAWMREVSELETELRKAEKRGVKVVLFSLTELPEIGRVFSYGLNEKKLAEASDNKIILVRDMEELLMGEANKKDVRKVAWTNNKAIVMIAVNHIVLDITLYGLRMGIDVGDVVIETHPGELEILGQLMTEKFPDNPWLNNNAPYRNRKIYEALNRTIEQVQNGDKKNLAKEST